MSKHKGNEIKNTKIIFTNLKFSLKTKMPCVMCKKFYCIDSRKDQKVHVITLTAGAGLAVLLGSSTPPCCGSSDTLTLTQRLKTGQ